MTVWDNQLSSIPSTISNLTEINYLDIDGNLFSEVPDVILQLVSLDTLWLNNNNITFLPDSIDVLSELLLLDVSGESNNKFT